MGNIGGITPGGQGPKKIGPENLTPASDERIPSNWNAAIKKYPKLLQDTLKMMAMRIMKDMKKAQAKMKKND